MTLMILDMYDFGMVMVHVYNFGRTYVFLTYMFSFDSHYTYICVYVIGGWWNGWKEAYLCILFLIFTSIMRVNVMHSA